MVEHSSGGSPSQNTEGQREEQSLTVLLVTWTDTLSIFELFIARMSSLTVST